MNRKKHFNRKARSEGIRWAAAPLSLLSYCRLFRNRHRINTEIKLSCLFRNSAVLQQGKPVPVWGKAQPGKTVTVAFADQEKSAVAGKDGSWMVYLDPLQASATGREMVVAYQRQGKDFMKNDENYTVTVSDILVGEVWFCSGQSNMEMGMGAIENSRQELKDSRYPAIRLYMLPKSAAPFPLEDSQSLWFECNRENLTTGGWDGFSAVAFFFGRKLYNELQVPVGLIQAAYGGSPVFPWVPLEDLKTAPVFRQHYRMVEAANNRYLKEKKKNKKAEHPFAHIEDSPQLQGATAYNSMVHPAVPYAIRGVLWYQGESNVGDPTYPEQIGIMLQAWRRVFGQGDFPFYFVQLAPYDYGSEESLPLMWEYQEACLELPNTGMAAGVDAGDPGDIHPRQKRVIGERLALLALAKTYNRHDIVYSGPVYTGMRIENNTAVISFDHTGSGLVSGDGAPPGWFTIAGENRQFVRAQAEIAGNTVIVRSDRVKNPVAVRYAWSSVVTKPNLYNREGLPALPFRTDK